MNPPLPEFTPTFFHGTKADLGVGDLLTPGYDSNYVADLRSRFVYVTSNLTVATWGAELARGDGAARIYVVEATGEVEDDPNVTNKRFPGNPTRSYRTGAPVRVVGEVVGWVGHTQDQVQARKDGLAQLMATGAKIVEE